MVHTFTQTATGTTQATATPLRTQSLRCAALQVFAPIGNAAPITLYGVEPSIPGAQSPNNPSPQPTGQQNQLTASTAGITIAAGGAMFFPFVGGPSCYDASLIFVTSTNGTDSVQVCVIKP